MPKVSKRYKAMQEAVGSSIDEPKSVADAVAILKQNASAKFDESVELAFRLNIDPKQSDQLVRGSFSLPHGTGKSLRVVAFAEGEAAAEATEAGATEIGGEDLAKKIQGGWLDFDVVVAHPSMMKHVGKLGKMLGPKGLMPSPKSGTVTPNVGMAVREFSAGKIEFRNDAHGIVSVAVGKAGFDAEKIVENIDAFVAYLVGLRPQAVKGTFINTLTVSSTMGLGYPLAI